MVLALKAVACATILLAIVQSVVPVGPTVLCKVYNLLGSLARVKVATENLWKILLILRRLANNQLCLINLCIGRLVVEMRGVYSLV